MRCQWRGHRLREADAQDERSGAAKDHNRKVHDRDRQVLQRRVRAGPTGRKSFCQINEPLLHYVPYLPHYLVYVLDSKTLSP